MGSWVDPLDIGVQPRKTEHCSAISNICYVPPRPMRTVIGDGEAIVFERRILGLENWPRPIYYMLVMNWNHGISAALPRNHDFQVIVLLLPIMAHWIKHIICKSWGPNETRWNPCWLGYRSRPHHRHHSRTTHRRRRERAWCLHWVFSHYREPQDLMR